MQDRQSALNAVLTEKKSDISYEIEIGSLPKGFDIRFVNNHDYSFLLGSSENSSDIEITKQSGAPKGNFNIPIIFTQKGVFDSSVICQLNIINN